MYGLTATLRSYHDGIQQAFEAASLELIPENGGEAGVRPKRKAEA